MIQSIEDHAGPNDEAYGASVKKLCPALFLYLSPKLSFMWTPNGETVTALKPSAFKPSRALGDFGIGAVLCHCPRGHGFEQIHIAFLVEEATIVGTDAGWPSKSWSSSRSKLYGRTPEAVPSFPKVSRSGPSSVLRL